MEDLIYDAIYSFFSGRVWGVQGNPPFGNARTFKDWIDGHVVLRRIVMSRVVSVVEELNGNQQFPDSVLIVALLRVKSSDINQLLQVIEDEPVIIHRDPTYHIVNPDTIAARVKRRRRLRHIN